MNAILDELDLTDIYRTLHPRTKEYSFYSNAHGTFSRIDHVLGHKTGLNRYQKIEIIPCIFSDHNALKLELKHKEKFGRNSNTWKLRTILLKKQIKQFMETNENEYTTVQNLWDTAKAVLRGKYIAIQASLKRIEKSKMQFLYSHLKKLEQQQRDRPNPLTRKQLTKIRAEINELETRRTLEQINRTRSWIFERINKIYITLVRLVQKQRERTEIIKIITEKGEITTNTNEIGRIIRKFINSCMLIN